MMDARHTADAVVIGGGFYGAVIAVYLAEKRGMRRVVLLEQEPELLRRASFNNQARVHSGYHYPRSFTTAYRSRINFPKFINDWNQVVLQDIVKVYAIARRNSKVTAKQFERFCHQVEAPIRPAERRLRQLFEPRLIEEVFLVEECVFDANKLAQWATEQLKKVGVEVHFGTQATAIHRSQPAGALTVKTRDQAAVTASMSSRYVFNCTYSGLNQFTGDFPGITARLKHELTEMALIRVPREMQGLGVTVMDGPFFSVMPFPSGKLHTLSHVRYTPHTNWLDEKSNDPYGRLARYNRVSRVDRMVRDVARYMPSASSFEYVESLFEVKTVLMKNESDDGRPILFERHRGLPGCYSVLGGKIDNIYDVLEKLDGERLEGGR